MFESVNQCITNPIGELSHQKQSAMTNQCIPYTSRISEYAFITYFFILSFFPFNADIVKSLCLLIVISCWIILAISEKRILFAKTTLNIPIFLFLICSFFASFHSTYIKDSFHTVLFDYLPYFITFFCMVNTIRGQEQIQRIVKAMLITCGLVCAYGLYAYYTGIAVHANRLVATFEYPSRIAKYISLLLPVAVCLFFYYKNISTRLYIVLLILICSFSLILTMSRASWVAIFITILFIFFAVKRKYLSFIFIGVCALFICILPSKFIAHAKTITQVKEFFSSEKILGERLLCWKASFSMIREHPIIGIGPGSRAFRDAYQQYGQKIRDTEYQQKLVSSPEKKNETIPAKPEKVKTKKKNRVKKVDKLSHPHNIFLHIYVGTGIVGLLTFLWLFATVFYKAVKSWRLLTMGYDKMLLLGITASLISIFLHGFTDSFWKKPDALFLWYIIGILFVIVKDIENRISVPSGVSS